jgi:hypothetical protein
MRRWTIQVDRRALSIALRQACAYIVIIAVIGLMTPKAAFDEFFWVAAITVAVLAAIVGFHFLGACIKIVLITAVASSAAPPERSRYQSRQLGRPR